MKKKYIIIISAVIALAIIAALFFILGGSDEHMGNKVSTTLYYINSTETSIHQKTSSLNYTGADDLVYKITDELKKSTYNKTVPEGTRINSIERYDDNSMLIDLSRDFLTDNIDYNTLRTYAYIKSINAAGSVIDVSSVKVSVNGSDIIKANGEIIDFLHADAVNLSSDMADISDDVVALYHLTKSGKLKKETYSVAVSGKLSTERFILDRLAVNPANPELKSAYSNSDDITSVQTKDGICFVNLKKSFVSANTGKNKERAVIYSMVNSLTELDDVDSVIFLIDGKREDMFGNVDISKALYADYSLVE